MSCLGRKTKSAIIRRQGLGIRAQPSRRRSERGQESVPFSLSMTLIGSAIVQNSHGQELASAYHFWLCVVTQQWSFSHTNSTRLSVSSGRTELFHVAFHFIDTPLFTKQYMNTPAVSIDRSEPHCVTTINTSDSIHKHSSQQHT